MIWLCKCFKNASHALLNSQVGIVRWKSPSISGNIWSTTAITNRRQTAHYLHIWSDELLRNASRIPMNRNRKFLQQTNWHPIPSLCRSSTQSGGTTSRKFWSSPTLSSSSSAKRTINSRSFTFIITRRCLPSGGSASSGCPLDRVSSSFFTLCLETSFSVELVCCFHNSAPMLWRVAREREKMRDKRLMTEFKVVELVSKLYWPWWNQKFRFVINKGQDFQMLTSRQRGECETRWAFSARSPLTASD